MPNQQNGGIDSRKELVLSGKKPFTKLTLTTIHRDKKC